MTLQVPAHPGPCPQGLLRELCLVSDTEKGWEEVGVAASPPPASSEPAFQRQGHAGAVDTEHKHLVQLECS